ncbi:hypothetical protein [Sorangium sp. So ce1335]|uniref:hypothetical protein n=1 Tax=Sorangium sp. So ce1335 TaxID=3133335 RepID=UPI003F621BC0
MGVNDRPCEPHWLVVTAVLAVSAALSLNALRVEPPARGAVGREAESSRAVSSQERLPARDGAPRPGSPSTGDRRAAPLVRGPTDTPDDTAGSGYPVDPGRPRSQLPDNLSWQLGAQTDDPREVEARAAEQRRWEELLGKVQSSTASEEEILRYHEHRRSAGAAQRPGGSAR